MSNKDILEDELELQDDGNEIEEGHDEMSAEDDSVSATKKAEKAGPKATQPKTKGGKVKKITDKMQGMTSEQFDEFYNAVMEDSVVSESIDAIDTNYDFTEDLNALVDSEATLSEEFKDKTAVIFEAAIKSKLAEEIDRLEESYTEQLTEATEEMISDLTEKVDGYLNLVVENWMTANEIAVQAGLRTEIAESFMNNLKDLFVESFVEVPESKVDLVDELSQQVAELEEALNSTTQNSINERAELEAYKRDEIIRESSNGLAETQVEKLKQLVEDVDFNDADSFAHKVNVIAESYFSSKTPKNSSAVLTESYEGDSDEEEVVISEKMNKYLTAIRKSSNK